MTSLKAIDEEGELSILLEKVGEGPLGVEELGQLVQWTRRWLGLKAILEKGSMTFKDLRALLLGLTREAEKEPENDGKGPPDGEDEPEPEPDEEGEKKKRKGHGSRAAKDYRGCRRVDASPADLKPGDECPECVGMRKGRLRCHKPHRPLTRLRLSGGAPITGTIYVGHRLCCGKCGAQFRPDWPQDANRET